MVADCTHGAQLPVLRPLHKVTKLLGFFFLFIQKKKKKVKTERSKSLRRGEPRPGETSGRSPLSTVLFTANEAALQEDGTGRVTGGMKAKSSLSLSTDGTGEGALHTMQEGVGSGGFINLNTSSYLAV